MRYLSLPSLPSEKPVSVLGLGGGDLGTRVKDDDARRVIEAFFARGGTLLDTAHCYAFWRPNGLGASEREIGACLRDLGLTERAVLATKGGHPDNGSDYRRPDAYLSEAVITRDLEESRERLGIATIDLYFLHRDDGRVPVGEIMDLLNRQIAVGAIRCLGASNWSVERIGEANAYARAHGLKGFEASQVQWSLSVPTWRPDPDPTTRFVTDSDADAYRALGIPILAYSAVAGGYFSRESGASEKGSWATPQNAARRERARLLAVQHGVSPTQVALAYLLCQPGLPVAALCGTGSLSHLAEAAAATELRLTPDDLHFLHEP